MAYPEYSNIEIFQGEDFSMEVDLGVGYTMTNKEWKAFLSDSYSSSTRNEFTLTSSGTKLTLKLTKDQTQSLVDDFDGYWDLMEKDTENSTYTRILQGEAKLFPQITKDEDFS